MTNEVPAVAERVKAEILVYTERKEAGQSKRHVDSRILSDYYVRRVRLRERGTRSLKRAE